MATKDEENEMMVTVWGNPDERVTTTIMRGGRKVKIVSGYGNVTYREWCELELARISSKTSNIKIVENKSGQIALARIR